MTNKTKILGILFAFAAAAPIGCGGDDNGTDTIDTTTPDAGKKSDAGGIITVKDTGTEEQDSEVTTDDDGGATTGDAGTDSDGGPTGCVPVDGCFCGTPSRMEDFLNACTDADTVTKVPVIPLANPDGTVTPL